MSEELKAQIKDLMEAFNKNKLMKLQKLTAGTSAGVKSVDKQVMKLGNIAAKCLVPLCGLTNEREKKCAPRDNARDRGGYRYLGWSYYRLH